MSDLPILNKRIKNILIGLICLPLIIPLALMPLFDYLILEPLEGFGQFMQDKFKKGEEE